jgi:hypothetical protein
MDTKHTPTPWKLHPFCNRCGWRKGGVDSWNGRACKCGHSEPPLPEQPATVTDIQTRAIERAPVRDGVAP